MLRALLEWACGIRRSDNFPSRVIQMPASCRVDRKNINKTCQFLGNCLVSWSFKKQNSVALSTAEEEYVAAGTCCAQVLWMKHTHIDYDLYKNIL